MDKYFWKHYCWSCKSTFISEELEIYCIYCSKLGLQATCLPSDYVKVVIDTTDIDEFCNKLNQLLENEDE